MSDEKIIVQLRRPEREFVKVYQDFLHCQHLKTHEKIVYIALKSFVGYGKDADEVYPSLDTLCKITGLSEQSVRRAIKALADKKVIEKQRRGLTKTNLYTLNDSASMWGADTIEEMREVAQRVLPYSDEELLEEVKRRGLANVVGIKKEPASSAWQSEDTSSVSKASDNIQSRTNNVISNEEVCQPRYSLENIHELYDYDILLTLADQRDVDAVMDILYDTMNTIKPTIRVGKENRPAMVVISKLMRLTHVEILYSIKKFGEQTGRINNPKSYMLTILYEAKEQMTLDTKNQVKHDGAAE